MKNIYLLSNIEANFLLNFFAIFLSLFTFIHFVSIGFFLNSIAQVQSIWLSGLGIFNYPIANQIILSNASFLIVPECSGLVMCSMLAGLIFSTNVKRKFHYLLIFSPLLVFFNLFRLFFTILSGAIYGQSVLDVVHTSLWFVDTGLVFYLWSKIVERKNTLQLNNLI